MLKQGQIKLVSKIQQGVSSVSLTPPHSHPCSPFGKPFSSVGLSQKSLLFRSLQSFLTGWLEMCHFPSSFSCTSGLLKKKGPQTIFDPSSCSPSALRLLRRSIEWEKLSFCPRRSSSQWPFRLFWVEPVSTVSLSQTRMKMKAGNMGRADRGSGQRSSK